MDRAGIALFFASLVASAAVAAPAPLPKKPPRVNDVALVEGLRAELKDYGVVVKDLAPVGTTGWQIKADDSRPGCQVVKWTRLVVASSRGAALYDLLIECRRVDEERTRRLRQLGVIP